MNKLDLESVTGISALLVHAAKIDEIYTEHEKDLIRNFIQSYLENENINEISIQPNNYIKLVEYLGVDPKVHSYENNFINVSFKSNYNNDNIHFLLNFF